MSVVPSPKPMVLPWQLYIAGWSSLITFQNIQGYAQDIYFISALTLLFSSQCRLVSIIGKAESVPALDVPRRSLGGAVADLGKLDYDNLPEAASR